MSFLGLSKNYKNIIEKDDEESDIYKIFEDYVKQESKDKMICLKVLDKKNTELQDELDIDFFIKQIEKEGKILKEIKSDHIIQVYNIIDIDKYFILEFENYDKNLNNYMEEVPIFEKGNKDIFKKIIITLVQALKELKKKGIIHRNIKPNNIFKLISEEDDEDSVDNFEIKLANFDCAIYKNEVQNSKPMGTLMCSAPEIINNLNYDEKSDLWSLGITLYEIYFGCLPFGQEAGINEVENILDGKEKFLYRKSYIPSLDVLFKRLLCINPDERMSLEELDDFIENEDFLKEDKIYNNEKYPQYNYIKIYEEIKKEEQINYHFEKEESDNPFEETFNSITKLFKKINHQGITQTDDEKFKDNPKFNNILYYDEIADKKYIDKVYADCDVIEENTPGAFIFCEDFESLKIITSEILERFKKNNKFKFNLITTGNAWQSKIYKMLKEDENFKNLINKVCIYCKNLKKYNDLSKKHDIIKCVWCSLDPVVKFIEKTSSKDFLPFPSVKLVTYEAYKKNYKRLHFKISEFYGENKKESFDENYPKIKKLINEEHESKKLIRIKEVLLKSFKKFDVTEEIDQIKSIIKEYTNNSFYGDFNKWLMSLEVKYYYTIAYFTARLIYCLNEYGKKYAKYFGINDSEIYRGIKLPLINLLPYKRAEHKVILFSSFTSTSRNKGIAFDFAKKKKNDKNKDFSVIFYIKNTYKKNWVPNGIDVEAIAIYKIEKEILFQAFSFYYVEKVEIDIKNKTANIYLTTIGKKCILEEEIKKGKEIEYNKKENVIEIKK